MSVKEMTEKLFAAAERGNMKKIIELLEYTDPNVKDGVGDTPLHLTCFHGHTKTAQLLIDHGADVNAKNNNDHTPLQETCHPRTVKLLIERGADVNAGNKYGWTSLHEACAYNHLDIARLLLIDHGADVNVKNIYGEVPLDGAISLALVHPHREELIDLFRELPPE